MVHSKLNFFHNTLFTQMYKMVVNAFTQEPLTKSHPIQTNSMDYKKRHNNFYWHMPIED